MNSKRRIIRFRLHLAFFAIWHKEGFWNTIYSTQYTRPSNISKITIVQPFRILKGDFSHHEASHFCLVILCDQNSFGRSKMVLVWANLLGLDHNDLVTTKMKWSRPKWIGLVQIEIHFGRKSWFGPDQFILVMTISFWSRPNDYGHIMVKSKSIWSDQNHFGPTKTVLVT